MEVVSLKALTLRQIWAYLVLFNDKSVECRTWQTDYRGNLLICSSSGKEPGLISGHALCVVELASIEPFTKAHLSRACLDKMPEKDSYAWNLANMRYIKPFPVKGKLHLFDVDDSLVTITSASNDISDDEFSTIIDRDYLPLVYRPHSQEAKRFWFG